MLPKSQELAFLQVKPQTLCKFKVGATKDGKIYGMPARVPRQHGRESGRRGAAKEEEAGPSCTSTSFPTGRENGLLYRTNLMRHGPVAEQFPARVQVGLGTDDGRDGGSGRHGPDEVPAAERAEARDKDGHRTGRSDDRSDARDRERIPAPTITMRRWRVLEEGAKVIGWDKRNPVPGGNPGRFKRGIRSGDVPAPRRTRGLPGRRAGLRLGAVESESGKATSILAARVTVFNAELELNAEGQIVMHFAQPDSGTNHGTSMSIQVAKFLGYTNSGSHPA